MGVVWEWLGDEHDFTSDELAKWMFEMIPPEMKS
jgi:hypothetical protein